MIWPQVSAVSFEGMRYDVKRRLDSQWTSLMRSRSLYGDRRYTDQGIQSCSGVLSASYEEQFLFKGFLRAFFYGLELLFLSRGIAQAEPIRSEQSPVASYCGFEVVCSRVVVRSTTNIVESNASFYI